jgi:hypothetical protein
MAVLAVALSAVAPVAAAEGVVERRYISDKFFVSLGSFVVDFNTSAQAGRNRLQGQIEIEDELGVDPDSTTFRIDGFYRFRPKHAIDFGYFSLNRNGSKTLSDSIIFNEVLYDIGASISTGFDVDLFRATYRYSFVNDGRTEAGFIAGLSTYDFGVSVDGDATIDDGSGGTTIARRASEGGIIAPIPVGGLFVSHAFTPKWVIRLNASFFKLESGDYAGRVVDTSILFDWYFSRHVGIGAGTSNTDIEFSEEGDSGFEVEYKQDGLMFYAAFVF